MDYYEYPLGSIVQKNIPTNGIVLGLDISVTSTGVCMLTQEGILLGNIHLEKSGSIYQSIERRLKFKKELTSLLKGRTLYHVVVEDIFFGSNAKTYRELTNLNNVIDELIVTNQIPYLGDKEQLLTRVESPVWKRWIRQQIQDDQGIIHAKGKYLAAKQLVRESLESLGFNPDSLGGGKGNQDRCDALGMAYGWLISQQEEKKPKPKKKTQQDKELELWYSTNLAADKEYQAYAKSLQEVRVSNAELYKHVNSGYNSLVEWLNLTAKPGYLYVVPNASLGSLSKRLGFKLEWGIHTFAFCIK